MAFRQLFKVLFRKTRPVMYATGTMFVSCAENNNKPNSEHRVQWEPPDFTKLTYDYMIKQSTVEIVNSVTQSLTVTYTAIEASSKEYRHSLSQLMSLIKETLMYKVSDNHWDLIVEVRSEVQRKKQIVTQLIGYMDYVNKVAIATTEASYMAGLDNLSMTLAQRMDDALNNMEREIAHNLQLEKEYLYLQEECAKKTNKDVNLKTDEETRIMVETILED